jgi:hypothetical protein
MLGPTAPDFEVDLSSETEAAEWLLDNPGDPTNPHAKAGRADTLPDKLERGGMTNRMDEVMSKQASPHKVLTNLLKAEIASIDYSAPMSDDPNRQGEIVTIGMSIIRRLVNIILTGRDRDSIEAAKIAWAYMDGLPVQPIEFDISGVVAELAAARGLSTEDTQRALDETRRILNAAKSRNPISR